MHIMLGMGNNLLDDCLKLPNSLSGLENLPETVRHDARQQCYDFLAVETDCKQEMDAWMHFFGPGLVECRENRSAAIHYINGGHGSLTCQEISLVQADQRSLTTRINGLVNDHKEIEKRVQQVVQQTTKARKNMWEKDGSVSNTTKWLRMEVEQNFLEPYGVTRAAYHGGDLVGPSVKALMANADDIFSSLEVFLLDVANEKKVLNDEEIDQLSARMRFYRYTLRNFDGFFSLLRDKHSDTEYDEKMKQLKLFLDTALQCWRRLNISITPKLHLLEDHVFDIIQNIKTLEYFDEEFVERAHQKGIKYNEITKGMSHNPLRKYNYMVRWEQSHAQSALERSQDRDAHHQKRGRNE